GRGDGRRTLALTGDHRDKVPGRDIEPGAKARDLRRRGDPCEAFRVQSRLVQDAAVLGQRCGSDVDLGSEDTYGPRGRLDTYRFYGRRRLDRAGIHRRRVSVPTTRSGRESDRRATYPCEVGSCARTPHPPTRPLLAR